MTHAPIDPLACQILQMLAAEQAPVSLPRLGKQLGQKEHALMLGLRRLFDPNGILNPGKGY